MNLIGHRMQGSPLRLSNMLHKQPAFAIAVECAGFLAYHDWDSRQIKIEISWQSMELRINQAAKEELATRP